MVRSVVSAVDRSGNPLRDEGLLCIHLFCATDSHHEAVFRQDAGLAVNGRRTDKHLVATSEPTRKVVDQVLYPLGAKAQIDVLRILCHGNAGYLDFNGMQVATHVSPEWRRLRSYFAPGS